MLIISIFTVKKVWWKSPKC